MNTTFGLPFLDSRTRSEEGQWITILNPVNGQPALFNDQPVQIKVAGPDSSHFNRATAQLAADALQSGGQTVEEIKGYLDKEYGDEARLLAGLTLDWRNVPDGNQQPLPFSHELAKELYQNFPVISEQVHRFINTRRNWMLEVQENLAAGHPANSGSNGMPKVTSARRSVKSSAKAQAAS